MKIEKNKYPFVTIIVPAVEQDSYLRECIKSLEKLNYPRHRMDIIPIYDKDKRGAAWARNKGVKQAKNWTDLFAFTDADCIVSKDWLLDLVEAIENAPKDVGCVGGVNLVPKQDNKFAKAVGVVEGQLKSTAQASDISKKRYVTSIANCNALYRKSCWQQEKQNLHFYCGQDGEFNHRLYERGWKFIQISGGYVWHHRQDNISKYFKKMFQYGQATTMITKKHGLKILKKRWYAIPPLVLVIIISLALFFNIFKMLLVPYFLFLIYKTIKLKNILVFPIMLTQHLGYGIGEIGGIFK